jgi:hypothetical protein
MMKVFNLINKKQILAKLEDTSTPLLFYFLNLFAFILIENFLEVFSDPGFVSFKLFPFSHRLAIPASTSIAIHVSHCSLWWFAVVLLFPIVFALITKENIDKTLRVVLSFSWLIILTPIIDLILSQGKGINIHYLSPRKITDLLSIPLELTPGENLTAIIAIILVFSYCFIKTRRIIKALIGTILISLGVLIAFLLPFIIKQLAGIFQIKINRITPVLVTRLLIFAIFTELCLISYLRAKKYFLSVLKSMGLFKTLHFILIFILGMLLFKAHIGRLILENIGSFILSVISILLVWALANIISELNSQEPLNSKHSKVAIGVFLAATASAISINFTTLYFILLAISASIIYLLPPIKLKRFPLISKILISFNLFLLVLLGWLFAGGEILEFPNIFTIFFLVFFTLCMNFMDIKDYITDKKTGLRTLPVEFGEKRAKFLIGFTVLITYIAAPWLFLEKMLLLPALILGLLQFYLINRKNYKETYVFLVYLLSLVAILLWLNFFRVPA